MTELSPQDLLRAAEAKQRAAADPSVSAWVRANAGTGKTHVLVQRMLRLLLSGADARSILCLTFTKNAAAEMDSRVLLRLGEWATADEAALSADLGKLLGRAPSASELAAAPCLFATVIDAPGGLAIQTIHGFCERVLRRYSFEANVPPGFTVLTEEEARDALAEAQAQAFASAKSGALRDAFTTVVAYAGEIDFARVLGAMLGHRGEILPLLQYSGEEAGFDYVETALRRLFGLGREDTKQRLLERSAELLPDATLIELVALLREGGKKDFDAAIKFQEVLASRDADARHAALKAVFATQKGEPRKSLMSAACQKRAPALNECAAAAQARFFPLDERLQAVRVTEATLALLRLTAAIFERYEAEKRARGAVDFDDLIASTLRLFSREEAAQWVLYQLDARIDHILVDEAQDTSPAQWEIVEKLTADFFSGEGARTVAPTLFAVGDEKQSIYGFQGAAPELLARYGAAFEGQARDMGVDWRTADLDLSFRTLGLVLSAVDKVTAALPGLPKGGTHAAFRRSHPGLVELWEPERGDKQDKGSVWEPDTNAPPPPHSPAALAERIAATIRHWLDSGTALEAAGRPIAPGDILILLRKRQPMATLLQTALKSKGIPVSGADRVALLDELAVMDLLSLAGALLQPEDDLALAEVLKSPLFGFSDDDLFDLSYCKTTSLWQALEKDNGPAAYRNAAAKLAEWKRLAHRLSPFDFFSHILEAERGRKAFAARLGPECFDTLDELLNLAESFGEQGRSGLTEFLTSLRRGTSEVKRETEPGAQQVRIMTVHAAKGLEANIVILADTCGNRNQSPVPIHLIGPSRSGPRIPVWAVKGSSRLAPIAEAKEQIKADERLEMGRLLYVAMTRARDCLYITGFHQGELPASCWFDTVQQALLPHLEEDVDFQGRRCWRYGAAPGLAVAASPVAAAAETAMPGWLSAPLHTEEGLPVLLPSDLADNLIRPHPAAAQPPSLPLRERGGGERDRKSRDEARAAGVLVHRLMETLAQLPPPERESAARAIASAFSGELSAAQRQSAVDCAIAALDSAIFSDASGRMLSEANIAVTIGSAPNRPTGIIAGQIDHIRFDADAIRLLDYKSGEDEDLAGHYAPQLAAYRLALRRLYPDVAIRAALLDMGSLTLHEPGDAVLDEVLEQLIDTATT